MKRTNSSIALIVLCFMTAIFFFSCKKDDYIIGGTLHNPQVNVSTYDYLQSNGLQIFDTVLMLVDKAGLKDAINAPGITFFAPTDAAVYSYLNKRTIEAQKIDPFAKYTLDSLFKYDLDRIKDSLNMYIVKQPLTYDKLTNDGAIYQSALSGNDVVVSFEYTTNGGQGYNEAVSSIPQITYFTQLWQPLEPPFKAEDIPEEIGVHTRCQTSGIQTTSGILNVLESSHILFFYGTQK